MKKLIYTTQKNKEQNNKVNDKKSINSIINKFNMKDKVNKFII